MTISYLQSILIGLVSGLADFLPVSGDAHRLVVGNLVGLPLVPPAFCLFLHLGALAALVISCRNDIFKLRRERAIAQAKEFGHSTRREVGYLTIHSVLHLLGYDHLDEGEQKRQMRAREEAIAARVGGMQRS